MRIGILTQYFEPEIGAAPLRYRAVTRALADAGHDVVVVTSLPNHPTGRIFEGYRGFPYRTEHTDVATVHRSWLFPAVGSGLRRYLNFLSFAVAVLPLLRHLRRCDVVLVESPPITVGALGLLVRYVLRRPYVTYVSDLSSNSLADLEIPGGALIGGVMRRLEDAVYRRGAAVTVVTDGQVRTLTDEFGIDADDILMMQNGADTELFGPRDPDPAVLERFGVRPGGYVLYAGTHGFAHGLDVAIEAAALMGDDDTVFLFVGEGSDKERIVGLAEAAGVTNCSFFGQEPPDVVAELYAGSLAGLSTVRDIGVMRDAWPAKLFATMSSAKPIIYSGAGEGAGIVEAGDAGIVCEVEQPQPIVEAIRYLRDHPEEAAAMGAAGRAHIESHFSWPVLVGGWLDAVAPRLERFGGGR